ncbi:MAG TPA: methyltransferase [Candidatus Omnitrophota bacterium]|nr:methyltransferase [Candidatus Omnitrophota bacterium]
MKHSIRSANFDYPESLVSYALGGLTDSFLQLAIKTGFFSLFREHPKLTLLQISRKLKMPAPSTRVFMQYLARLELIKYSQNRIQLTPISRRYLLCKHQSSLAWLRHLSDLRKSPSRLNRYLKRPPEQIWHRLKREQGARKIDPAFYSGWLHARRVFWGEDLARIYNFKKHIALMDLGCASAGWSISILKRHKHLKAILVDLPEVHPFMLKEIQKAHLQRRVRLWSGSFFDVLPKGADVVLLANVLHDWNEANIKKILRQVYRALPRRGKVLVWEFFLEDNFKGSFMALVQALAVLGRKGQSGWQPTYREMRQILKECGFKTIHQKDQLIVAQKI